MSAFGVEVMRRLAAMGKDVSWLHVQTKIAHSTISNWVTDPDVQPKPASVAKVEKALQLAPGTLAPNAGYTIRFSADDGERAQRRAAMIAARPRLGQSIDQFDKLSARDEDVLLSMMETYIKSRLPPESQAD